MATLTVSRVENRLINFDDNIMKRALAEELNFELTRLVNEKGLFLIMSQFLMGSSETFGPEAWKFYYNVTVGPVPRPSKELLNFLLVQYTSLWLPPVLCPESIDGKPLTLRLLGDLVQNPQNGGHTAYYAAQAGVLNQHQDAPVGSSCWLVMRKGLYAREGSYGKQLDWIQKINTGYEVGTRTIHLVTLLFTRHVLLKGERHLGDRGGQEALWSYARCQELVRLGGKSFPLAVGGFTAKGSLELCASSGDSFSQGVVLLRKF